MTEQHAEPGTDIGALLEPKKPEPEKPDEPESE